VRGDVQGAAGAVIQPGQDLDVGTGCAVQAGEAVVGEVGLPAFVGLLGGEADVGGLGSLGRFRHDRPGPDQDPVDRGPRQCRSVMPGQVPADRVRARIQAVLGQLLTQPQHQLDRRRRCRRRRGLRPSRARRQRSLALGLVTGLELVDPGPVNPVPLSDLSRRLVLHEQGSDDQL
jgi:hypothetical protein